MCEDLDTQAEKYMRSVMNNDGDVFTRSDLYEYIIDAYKQGYRDALSPAKEDGMYLMSDEDCQRAIDILNHTREGCRKATENIKELTRLVSKEDFRNRLNHKGK